MSFRRQLIDMSRSPALLAQRDASLPAIQPACAARSSYHAVSRLDDCAVHVLCSAVLVGRIAVSCFQHNAVLLQGDGVGLVDVLRALIASVVADDLALPLDLVLEEDPCVES